MIMLSSSAFNYQPKKLIEEKRIATSRTQLEMSFIIYKKEGSVFG